MNEYEFILDDRIAKIQAINEQYDLEHNAYLSFSGGKDSTVLHYLLDMALPNNKIPRVFINTGIEYKNIRLFVEELAKSDPRIKIVNSGVNIKKMLNTYGYPFKSKEHSSKISEYKRGSFAKSVIKYMNGKSRFSCPNILLYQYKDDFNIKLSNKCCYKLKKDPFLKWERENNKFIAITGMKKDEGGQRTNMNCIVTKNDKIVKFHPLAVATEKFENWFVEKYNIKLCKLYYPPYSFKRTGCKGCPFALNLQKELDVMEKLLPVEKKQCEIIWKPVYDEYRRIGYRLDVKIFKIKKKIIEILDN